MVPLAQEQLMFNSLITAPPAPLLTAGISSRTCQTSAMLPCLYLNFKNAKHLHLLTLNGLLRTILESQTLTFYNLSL